MTLFRPSFALGRLAVLLAVAAVVGAACGSGGGTNATEVSITATDSECTVSRDELAAGAVAFQIANQGSKVTEVYVYAPGDKVVTERENIGPGTSATLNVSLAEGDYEIACKPGQTGDGIRAPIQVRGEGGAAAPTAYDREVEFEADEYRFEGLEGFAAAAGEVVEFKMENVGSEPHEFEVFGPDGQVLGEIGPTEPGEQGEVILALDAPGTYRFMCGIDDHASRGMTGRFEVSRA